VLIADAVVKGMTGFDYQTAYEALVKNAEVEPKNPLIEGRQLEDYKRLGICRSVKVVRLSHLEYAYDDFASPKSRTPLAGMGGGEVFATLVKLGESMESREALYSPALRRWRWLENFNPETVYPDTTRRNGGMSPFMRDPRSSIRLSCRMTSAD